MFCPRAEISASLKVSLTLLLVLSAVATNGENLDFTVQRGARVFEQRCTLCHGNDGMGNGLLPLSVGGYPSTNLLTPKYGSDIDSLWNAVFWGSAAGRMSELSPPWGNELTDEDLNAVVLFVQHVHENAQSAAAMIDEVAGEQEASEALGRLVFSTRCALCHGELGEGNGALSKVIKNPPPFNLTKSAVPDQYMKLIIGQGGATMGRSPQMPPWKDDLNEHEVLSVISYTKTLRK